MPNSLFHITDKIKIFIWGLAWTRRFIRPSKIACLHSLHLWAIYFAFTWLRLLGKMIIYAQLRLTKIILFRGLIKYLVHNHPHITTIFYSNFAHFQRHLNREISWEKLVMPSFLDTLVFTSFVVQGNLVKQISEVRQPFCQERKDLLDDRITWGRVLDGIQFL